MILRVRHEIIERNHNKSGEDQSEGSALDDAYQAEASYSLLDMLSRQLLGHHISDEDPTASFLCLMIYYVIKSSDENEYTFVLRGLSKPFSHVICEIRKGKKAVAYCDPAFFDHCVLAEEKNDYLKKAAVKLIKIAEEEKKLLSEIESNIIKEEKAILKQYIDRLNLYGVILDHHEDQEIREDINRLIKRIKRKKRARSSDGDKRSKTIYQMHSQVLSKPLRLRTLVEIAPDEQDEFVKSFEGALIQSVEDLLMTDIFTGSDSKPLEE
ncbi:MAG: hypothetical protein CMF48_01080 [Legionellales bacterium]|nr:hypothetical protein [Legionellales bacterium]